MKEVISLILKQITPNIYNADIRGYSFNVFEGLFVSYGPCYYESFTNRNRFLFFILLSNEKVTNLIYKRMNKLFPII